MTVLAAAWLLFVAAFLSATLLPGSSEALLIGFLASGVGQPVLLVAAASLGNIAGAAVTYGMGRYLLHYKDRPWFPLKKAASPKAQDWFARYGVWSLLLSWVPVIGDPLTMVAGVMRVPLGRFLLFVSVGKVARYALIVVAWKYWAG